MAVPLRKDKDQCHEGQVVFIPLGNSDIVDTFLST